LDRSVRYQHIEPLLSGTLNQDLILRRWDDLLRVAGSVKIGWVTASLLIGKLQSDRRQNALIRPPDQDHSYRALSGQPGVPPEHRPLPVRQIQPAIDLDGPPYQHSFPRYIQEQVTVIGTE
jgi:hypothetical protein